MHYFFLPLSLLKTEHPSLLLCTSCALHPRSTPYFYCRDLPPKYTGPISTILDQVTPFTALLHMYINPKHASHIAVTLDPPLKYYPFFCPISSILYTKHPPPNLFNTPSTALLS